jgi:hypothetical protein
VGEECAWGAALKRVLVLTEGQTEERFVKQLLQPHLWGYEVSIEPKIVTTKRVIGGAHQKGGGDATKILEDTRRLLGDSDAVAVTSFFDFYGFPTNLPGASEQTYRDIELLTSAFERAVSNIRFKAYLQRHEFEAFLFVEPQITAQVAGQPDKVNKLLEQRQAFETVEDINLDPTLAPSKRLQTAFGSYRKLLVGPAAAQRIGLDRLKEQSPRFATWLVWLESLGRGRDA